MLNIKTIPWSYRQKALLLLLSGSKRKLRHKPRWRRGGGKPQLSPGCQAVRCCQVICQAVGQLSGAVRCLCQTSCRVLSVLSGAVGCVSDIRGDL